MKNKKTKLYNILFGTLLSISMITTSLNLVWADSPNHLVQIISDDIAANDNDSDSILKTGDEDTSDYKKIKTIADLYEINNDLEGKYILMNDIDMSSTDGGDYDIDGCGWKPIGLGVGDNPGYFQGVLDGNGHVLKNLTIKTGRKYAGLFAYAGLGVIMNLGIENLKINSGGQYIGGIIGETHGAIENCYVTGTIQSTSESAYTGGIAGRGTLIDDCYTDVSINSKDLSGGISGYCDPDISGGHGATHCYSVKPVNSSNDSNMISNKNTECYYLSISGEDRDDRCAQGLSAGMMKIASSFTGFDFEKVWYIDPHAPNTNYPQLRSCPQDRITSVEIEKTPDKLEYLTTDKEIDLTGGTIKITYEDGTVVSGISMDEANVYYDLFPAGKQTVTVDYGGKTATFEITVKKNTPTIEGTLEYEKKVDDIFKLNLTTDSDGIFEYKYEPEEGGEKIIRLSDGYVECLNPGEAIVEASLPETDTFEAASEEIKITVKNQEESGSDDDDDDDDEETDKDGVKHFKITFDSNGGSAVPKQKVEEGDYIEEPSSPSKDGFIFDGWYIDKEFNNKWDFSSNLVHSKMTLYAKWVTSFQKAKEDSVIFNGDVVSYNGLRYYLSGTKVNGIELFNNAGAVFSSNNSVAKVNKKGIITFKKDGEATIAADTGESLNIMVFGKKPVSASIQIGETYAIPDEIMIETLGDLRYTNASKVAVSDDGKLTALGKGTVKIKYTQSGKTRVVLKLKIKK